MGHITEIWLPGVIARMARMLKGLLDIQFIVYFTHNLVAEKLRPKLFILVSDLIVFGVREMGWGEASLTDIWSR